jgi:hypothetical protein
MATSIRRKRKMTFTLGGFIGIFLITAFTLMLAAQAGAETVKYNYTTNHTRVEWVSVPDMKGHIAGIWERRGVAIFENEVAALTMRGTFDGKKGKLSIQGYSQTTFKDGSTITQKTQCTLSPPPGEKLRLYEGKGEYIEGTGRFEGIKGTITFTGREITPFTHDDIAAYNWIEVNGTYTLPKK